MLAPPSLATRFYMAEVEEKHSESSAASYKEARALGGNQVSAINERRRAALEDIDNAKFSYVFSTQILCPVHWLSLSYH